jgi:hypothetical protein
MRWERPGYMAPEQARGAEGADPRADVYALGVVLYQLMVGRLPYSGDTPMALVMEAASGQTVPVADIQRRLPVDLARIVVRCLEADPERRYSDAAELRQDLGAYLSGRSIAAPVLGRRYRAARWARSNPWRARLLLTLVLVVVGGAAVLAVQAEQSRRALNAATALIAEAERARGDFYVDQLLPLHDQRPAERQAWSTILRLESVRDDLGGDAAARVDAALADLLHAIGAPDRAFERARSAWRGGVQSREVASRATRARLQQYGARRLELGLSADPGSIAALVAAERQQLSHDLSPFLASIDAALAERVERTLSADAEPDADAPEPFAPALLSSPDDWKDRLLALQSAAAAAIEGLNREGESAIERIESVEAELAVLLDAVRSFRPAYRLGCQLAAARQSLRTMQGGMSEQTVDRTACDLGRVLDPGDPDLLAASSMQFWLRAKDLRRSRAPFEMELARAIDEAQIALDVTPDNELAQLSLGSALQVRGRQQLVAGEDPEPVLQASLGLLERLHRARPNDVNAMNNLAVTWSTIASARLGAEAIDAERQSLAWLERAAEAAPEDRRLVHNMLYARMSLLYQTSLAGEDPAREGRATIRALEQLSEQHPDYISPANTLGLMWWTLGVWDARVGRDPSPAMRSALSAFDQALQRRPDWESALINTAGVKRQWYSLARIRPNPALETLADEALEAYEALEPVDSEKSEFGCLVAEILAARARWRPEPESARLLQRAESAAALDRNIEWSHPDCHRVLARVGVLRRARGDRPAALQSLWETVHAAATESEDPEFLLHASDLASSMGREALHEEWRGRVPDVFRHALGAGDSMAFDSD